MLTVSQVAALTICSHCHAPFKSRAAMLDHQQAKHDALRARERTCDFPSCGPFKSHSAFDQHQKAKGHGPYRKHAEPRVKQEQSACEESDFQKKEHPTRTRSRTPPRGPATMAAAFSTLDSRQSPDRDLSIPINRHARSTVHHAELTEQNKKPWGYAGLWDEWQALVQTPRSASTVADRTPENDSKVKEETHLHMQAPSVSSGPTQDGLRSRTCEGGKPQASRR
uniref:C2H2-type domain-containing protein n=1 Tax=Chromera velia CCMP2878 TaxID=1169474 RepID=A0A0G4G2B6_9ALVE|eukprot:Cvel_19917.t1-p1 / transcript=Cvel_19917.t1 / gene=Cvel_19917 / organism=Chromera_velia_CCMP2878 / gene_product=hypothetical protein / transcript_product=hypothetical protein / location=Cvel_scaffold1751:32454-36217(+) / protein_length=223 / sequence_SO=supercontig / SO=protein_coding / is_pseudo=false